MNLFLIIILVILIGKYLLNIIIEHFNIKNLNPELPNEFKGYIDERKYKISQNYTRENSKFGLIRSTINIAIIIPFITFGGFNLFDRIVRNYNYSEIVTGIIYVFMLIFISQIIELPFSIYSTFIIEEKYGFNKTTIKTFISDIFKSLLLSIIIGVPILALILWFFSETGKLAPLYLWAVITLFQIFLTFIAPYIIMPLFNKFYPIEEGELKDAIENYTKKENFKMKGIFTMDGSKRSTKTNAFFTGFGKSRRIVFFDTLIKKNSIDEILTILAHEMGHYKLKHIFKTMIESILETGLVLLILSLFMNNRELFNAFRMDNLSIYASLIFFGFLYSPVSILLSIVTNIFSRKYEFEADRYVLRSTKKGEAFVSALKKLSVDNLSNLTPHPLKVFILYSHPPVLERINAIKDNVVRSAN